MFVRPTVVIGTISALIFWNTCSSVSGRSLGQTNTKSDITTLQLSEPAYGSVAHRIGRMVLQVNNNGTFGSEGWTGFDYFTGEQLQSCEYPKGSNTCYLFGGAFWIGAVVDGDTVVSCGSTGWTGGPEFAPDIAGLGDIRRRSIRSTDPHIRDGAVSEEDYIMVYYDTLTEGVYPDLSGRPHVPLNIKVTQSSYAWSYSYAEDIVLFDYAVSNFGVDELEDLYMGIYVDADVIFGGWGTYADDICGFIEAVPVDYRGCTFFDTVNIAWIADNDGDAFDGVFTDWSVPHITGTRIIRTPADSLNVSFNWWVSHYVPDLDFGPRERAGVGRLPEEFRDFGTGGLGTPEGDANKYYQMRNMEFDYDQVFTNLIGNSDSLWLPPNQALANDFSDGYDTRYLLSFGPFDLPPGETLPISFAYIAGENFHTDPANGANLPYYPDLFYEGVNFSDFALNAAWAEKIYDNPGFDTDGDGYCGKVRICCQDSVGTSLDNILDLSTVDFYDSNTCEVIWYEGDGEPDFRGAPPPPAPDFWLESQPGKIRVRINGVKSETSEDLFSGLKDFEGYRVYIARDERVSSYSLLSSYDRENFDKYVWTGTYFRLIDVPYTRDSLEALYADANAIGDFDPLIYTRDNPLFFTDSVFYFVEHDHNAAEFGTQTSIRKIYPDQRYPSSLNSDSVSADELTEDGYLKYFEYELEIDNLLPSILYWVNVTAFDFGAPALDLKGIESSLSSGAKCAYANTSARTAWRNDLKAYVYPNPYRADAGYRDAGFEGRADQDRPDDRVRQIHFANIPARCTIRVYSLDGDLVRELEHSSDPGEPTASYETWNMITRNTQMVASGLYYWTVEAEDGAVQVGKLVIIM